MSDFLSPEQLQWLDAYWRDAKVRQGRAAPNTQLTGDRS